MRGMVGARLPHQGAGRGDEAKLELEAGGGVQARAREVGYGPDVAGRPGGG